MINTGRSCTLLTNIYFVNPETQGGDAVRLPNIVFLNQNLFEHARLLKRNVPFYPTDPFKISRGHQ